MLSVEVRRLEIAPTSDQFWTIVSRINGPEFMGVLYRAREAIFDSAGIAFTIDLLNRFLQFDVTSSTRPSRPSSRSASPFAREPRKCGRIS
jgi:hypothetical protein